MRTESKSKYNKLKKKPMAENWPVDEAGIVESARTEPGNIPIMEAASSSAVTEITAEEKRHLIAEAAYFHAERRNFAPGNELQDWLDAEAEIETKLTQMGINRTQ
jgi:hypothetical protein